MLMGSMKDTPPASSISYRLKDKVVIIIGAAEETGIGFHTAKVFQEHGAKVIMADIQDEVGLKTAESISVTYAHCDVTNEDDVQNLVDRAVAKHGKLDVMFNNVGIVYNTYCSVLEFDKSLFERSLQVNVVGMFLAAKHAARVMIPNKTGSIIFMGSVAGSMACVRDHAYGAAKHGVVGLAKNLAQELGEFGIRVNCLSPYAVYTSTLKRWTGLEEEEFTVWAKKNAVMKEGVLKLEDISYSALYLASDESKYTSGQDLIVDGGFTAVKMFQS